MPADQQINNPPECPRSAYSATRRREAGFGCPGRSPPIHGAGAPRSSQTRSESADESRWRHRLSEVPFNLIAVRAGHAIGQASGTAVDVRARIELISMWVTPEVRGRGVADALVAAVAGYGSDVGAAAIRLSVRRHNERAIRFYTRINFELADEPADEPAEIAMIRSTRT